MFSPFSSYSNPFALPRFLGGNPGQAIDIKPVEIHHVEISHEKRARTLKHLLKLNHVNHSIVYHTLQFHNHLPHILGSAYLLGGNAEHLNAIYEHDSKELEPWKDSPNEVSRHDWRDYLGDPKFQRAYVDFFEDELVLHGYDWKKVVEEYLFSGKEPLVNCLIAGLGHPLIHLGYAYELSSREVAMEALGLAATQYNFLHKYLDQDVYTKMSTYKTSSPLEILQRVATDNRFDGLFDNPGPHNMETLLERREEAVLEHWNAWHLADPKKQFEDSQKAAAALLVCTHKDGANYDFFIVHLLTSSHAIRILLPFMPAKLHVKLVKQWWLLTLLVYISQLRPAIDLDVVTSNTIHKGSWHNVDVQALHGDWAKDAHFVKACRAMKEAAQTWGDTDQFYLKAAILFAYEFEGWF